MFRYRLRENALKNSVTAVERLGKSLMSPPISAKYLNDLEESTDTQEEEEGYLDSLRFNECNEEVSDSPVFPFQSVAKMEFVVEEDFEKVSSKYVSEASRLAKAGVDLEEVLSDKDDVEESLEDKLAMIKHEHGTPNRSIPPSNVPCGGCGAVLHCQDSSIPGWVVGVDF